jgi:RND family efflux transporter MFP subunit
MMPRHAIAACLVSLHATLLASGVRAQPGGGGPPPANVILDAARMETVQQWREVTGELQAYRTSTLAAQEDGWVVELIPREGDLVKEGDVIAKLDAKLAELQVARAEAVVSKWGAEVAQRKAELEKAERDLEKRRAISTRDAASETEVADADTAVAVAKARLDQAGAELVSAQAELGLAQKAAADMVIRSPMTARVRARRTEIGQWLDRGDPVVQLVELQTVEAWLDVPEAVAGLLQRSIGGATGEKVAVQVRIPALKEARQAEVVGIVPAADPLSRLVPIRVRLKNEDELIKPGMTVTGLVPTGTSEPALTIHKDALMRNDAGPYVYYNAGGTAQIARVEVLFAAADGSRLAVRSDRLQPGMELVVEGNERLFPGQPLAPGPAQTGPAQK